MRSACDSPPRSVHVQVTLGQNKVRDDCKGPLSSLLAHEVRVTHTSSLRLATPAIATTATEASTTAIGTTMYRHLSRICSPRRACHLLAERPRSGPCPSGAERYDLRVLSSRG